MANVLEEDLGDFIQPAPEVVPMTRPHMETKLEFGGLEELGVDCESTCNSSEEIQASSSWGSPLLYAARKRRRGVAPKVKERFAPDKLSEQPSFTCIRSSPRSHPRPCGATLLFFTRFLSTEIEPCGSHIDISACFIPWR